MNENAELSGNEMHDVTPPEGGGRWPKVLAIVFFCALVAGLGYAWNVRARASRLAADNAQMEASLTQTRGQLSALATRVEQMTAQQQQAQQAQQAEQAKAESQAHARKRRAPAEDARLKKLQAQIDEHAKEIADTRQAVDQTRSDFDNKLGSTRDELNGNIARNHDEVVALEKKGERAFFEYDVYKSKQFRRVGPIGISLRKANVKHGFCDLTLLVDDRELTRKHVNLFEPVLFYPSGYQSALEVVVYQVDKNHIKGYVSAPKYTPEQLASGSQQQSQSTGANAPAAATPQPAAKSNTPAASATAAQLEHRPN